MGDYHVTFLSRHLHINHLCDDIARWWSEWHEYSLNDDNTPVYGSRILFKPTRKPDLTKYMLWTDSVHLTDLSYFIHGTFNYDSRSDNISAKTFSPPALLQKQGSVETISDVSPIILLACNYTGSVFLAIIIDLSPILV